MLGQCQETQILIRATDLTPGPLPRPTAQGGSQLSWLSWWKPAVAKNGKEDTETVPSGQPASQPAPPRAGKGVGQKPESTQAAGPGADICGAGWTTIDTDGRGARPAGRHVEPSAETW